MSLSREDRSLLARWWFTVDQSLLSAALILFAVGLIVSLAASPAVATAKQFGAFHFVERHILHAAAGTALMLAISFCDPRAVRRIALVVFAASLAAMVVAVMLGPEINGARRWVRVLGLSVQPSEFAKPAFVVLAAWALAEVRERPDMPALAIAVGLFVVFALALIAQPDFGQTVLVAATFGALTVLAGLPLIWPAGLAVAGLVLLALAYLAFDYVRARIDPFLTGDFAAAEQTGRAIRAFTEGGLWGRGPGAGTIKTDLPDAHTDFIFAVIAEEYGAVACLALLCVFAFIVFRMIVRAIAVSDRAVRFALIGLAVLFGLQAIINMAVNVGLMPATGMTLPLISAGGSSMLAISATLGMALALSRRRPQSRPLRHTRAAGTPA